MLYLERVIHCNLSRLSRLLRILRFHAHDLNLKPSLTAYMRWGTGAKQSLRFTKTGDPGLEKSYATHLVRPDKGLLHPPSPIGHESVENECSMAGDKSGLTASRPQPALGANEQRS